MKVLVIGASGMIGSTVLRVLSEKKGWQVSGTVRNGDAKRFFPSHIAERIVEGVDVEHPDALAKVLDAIRPDAVINCAGLTKHKPEAEDPLVSIPINTLMPHRLAGLCKLAGARLIHVSTDCVFSGGKGNYTEEDFADARDVYGKSKALGEVTYPHTVTLRTSTIGHEFETKYGLLEWFLSQEGRCKGYNRAVFSGLPTVVFAEVVRDVVIPNPELSGLYHVAAQAINKFDLLKLIAVVYGKQIEIESDDRLAIDRSLDATRFREATGYVAPGWPELIERMHAYN
ncbi:MAG: SDR family oxidoreductase [Pseudomonadota bacterium]|jgi:dTDP-4-dehydrorhamnose reductase